MYVTFIPVDRILAKKNFKRNNGYKFVYIFHWMEQLRMLYSIILTLIFKGNNFAKTGCPQQICLELCGPAVK